MTGMGVPQIVQPDIDRDFDGELLNNCIGCCAELIQVGVENFLQTLEGR